MFLLALTLIFADPAKTRPIFIPAEAFNAPRQYGLTRAAIGELDRQMSEARDARRAIGDDADCATAPAQPRGDIDASGTIVEIAAGWDSEQRMVASLARVKLANGEEVLVEFPFGSMQVGRTTWCTGTTRLKAGDAIAFNARRAASAPERLICVSLPDHHGRNE